MKFLKTCFLIALMSALVWVGLFTYKTLVPDVYSIHFVNYRGHTDIDDGFEHQLTKLGVKYKMTYHDVNRDPKRFAEIVKDIRSDEDADLVVTWGTTTTLGIFGEAAHADQRFIRRTPGVFTLVTDPIGSRIVADLENPGRNITGSWHVAPLENQFRAMMVYRNSRKIGALYTPTENNSVVTIDELRKTAQRYGVELVTIPFMLQDGKPVATNAVEALQKMKSEGVEWLYLPPDSFLGVQARDLVIPTAHSLGLITFASTEQLMQAGAAFGLVCPYFELGVLAANKAKLILVNKRDPAHIPVDTVERFTHQINDEAVQRLGIKIPQMIRADISTVRIQSPPPPASAASR